MSEREIERNRRGIKRNTYTKRETDRNKKRNRERERKGRGTERNRGIKRETDRET